MRPTRIAGLSIFSNTLNVILKLIAGILTGSVAVISEAIHSLLDLMASVIAFFSVRISSKPADENHHYGHGKYENLSGTIETILLFIAGIWIIYESVKKIVDPAPINFPMIGIIVMLFGAGLNLVVGTVVKRVGEEMQSVAMRTNALHLLTDVYSSLGVAVSLIIVSLTDFYILDPLIGIGIAIYIIIEAFKLGKESFLPLLDVSLTPEEEQEIRQIIEAYKDEYIEYHDLRTRRSGPEEHIDFHLVLPSHLSIEEAHELCDRIEEDIEKYLFNPKVIIHIEPAHKKLE